MPKRICDFPIFRERPDQFIETLFGESLWGKQKEILYSLRDNRLTSVESCHASGKSFLSARGLIWFLYAFQDSKVITTAPSFRQVEDILWREVHKAKSKARMPLEGNFTKTKIDLGPDWFALGLSTDEPDRFQGFHAVNILLIVDEAAGVEEKIFEASDSIVSSEGARTLFLGNPTSVSGTFYNSQKPNSPYSKISISAFDTPNFSEFGIAIEDIRSNTWRQKITKDLPRKYLITPEWVSDKYVSWGEGSPMWDSRIMGKAPEQGEDTLIPLRFIENAIDRQVEVRDDDPEVIGVDVARMGSDFTIFTYRKGQKVLDFRRYSHMNTMETSQNLLMFATEHPSAAVQIDAIGVGAGVVDRLPQLIDALRVVPVNVGERAMNPELFINKRAEMYWSLRDRFVKGEISIPRNLPHLDDLMSQLSSLKFKFTIKGQIQIESKDDMKKRGLPSPDMADSLCICYGTVGMVSWRALTFTKPTITEATQQPTVDLRNEEERVRLEMEADLALIKAQQTNNAW